MSLMHTPPEPAFRAHLRVLGAAWTPVHALQPRGSCHQACRANESGRLTPAPPCTPGALSKGVWEAPRHAYPPQPQPTCHCVHDARDVHRLAQLVAAADDALLQQRHDLRPRAWVWEGRPMKARNIAGCMPGQSWSKPCSGRCTKSAWTARDQHSIRQPSQPTRPPLP